MDENHHTGVPGKRLSPDPHRSRKWVAVGAVSITVLLVAAYLALCAVAGGERLWPNTWAMGVDVSGQTAAQVAQTLRRVLPEKLAGQTVRLREPESGFQVTLTGEDLMEPTSLEEDLRAAQGGGSFLTLGGRYLMNLTSPTGQSIPLTLDYTQAGRKRTEECLQEVYRALGVTGGGTTYEVTDDAIVFTKGRSDATVDREALRLGLAAALSGTGPQEVELSLIQAPPAPPDFEAIRREIYAQVSEAHFDPETWEVVPSVTGRDLDVEGARRALEQTEEGGVCRVELILTQPENSTEELTALLFRDVLGEANTRVTGTSSRVGNVRTAAGYMNDVILLPDEVFSYLETCGPYGADKGYGEGQAYYNGRTVTTVGGGVCQGASTLYLATLRANLETVFRRAHGYEPSYIPGGLDATVANTTVDFKFKNSTEYPIKIESYMDEKNYVHVIIHGTNTTGIHGEPFSKNRVVTKYAETVYEPNENVPRGTTQKDPERTAYNAVTVEAYQKLVDADGNVIETYFLHKDTYRLRNAVILYNPADAALWGIDPDTGRQTLAPVTPEVQESVPPVETPAPAATPEVTATPAPVESQPVVDPPLLPSAEPTPDPTPEPVPSQAPEDPPPVPEG